MTAYRTHIARMVLLLVLTALMLPAQSDTLRFSFPDGKGKRGVTYAYPLSIQDSLTVADSLLAGEFTISYSGSVIDIVGIQKTGTILAGAADVQFNPATRKLSFAHPVPITGKGIFIEFLITVRNDASGSTSTSLQNILLNEGTMLGLITAGSMRPMDITIVPKTPPQDRIVGDTVQFSVAGDVNFPVVWSVGDTHIVSIDGTGRAIGKNVGQTTVTVTDNIGLTSESNLFPVHPPTLRSLTLTASTISVMQNLTFLYPLKVSTVTGLGITSAQFRLTYNPSVLTPLGVVTAGSMTQTWGEPAVLYGSNHLDVALAGATPLSDSGTLVFVRFKVSRTAFFSAGMNLSNVLFNENLNATVQNGTFNPVPGPVITIMGRPSDMLSGEQALLTASGGTAPYRWKFLADTSIAALDSITGVLTAKSRGLARFSVTDVNGFDRWDSLFVTDVRFHFPDTSFIYTDSIDYPVLVSSTTGYGILSAQLILPYDTAKLKFVSVIRGGTVSRDMTMELKDSSGLRMALSGVSPLSGAGQFFVLRFRSRGLLSLGHSQPMFFTQVQLNEGGVAARFASQRNGSLAVTNVPNYPPKFTAKLRDTTIAEQQLLQVQLAATDANGDSLLFGLFKGPSGMTITGKGLLSWRPTFQQAGTHWVVYDVGDYHMDGVTKDSAIVTVTDVNGPPVFTRFFTDTTITEDQHLNYMVGATDPEGDAVRYSVSGIPIGMVVDTITGNIAWRPSFTQAGTYPIGFVVHDGKGQFASRPASITVTNKNRPPLFTTIFQDTLFFQTGQTVSAQFTGTDPDNDPITFSLIESPTGAVITAAGLFTWTPALNQTGVHRIIVQLTDGTSPNRDTVFIRVQTGNTPPQFTRPMPDTVTAEGEQFSFAYAAEDQQNDPLTWSFGGDTPDGMTLSNTGVLAWKPDFNRAGTYTIIVRVSDPQFSVTDTALLTVLDTNRPPQFSAVLSDTVILVDSLFVYQWQGSDADNDSIRFALVRSPNGAVLTSGGRLSWVPAVLAKETLIVSLSDGIAVVHDTAVVTVTGLPALSVQTTRLDFGTTAFGTRPVQSVSVSNTGRIPLQLLRYRGIPDDGSFVSDLPDTVIVQPGGSTIIRFTYAPKQIGTHRGSFLLMTNDPRQPMLMLEMSGTAISVAAVRRSVLVDLTHQPAFPLRDSLAGMTQLFQALRAGGVSVAFAETTFAPAGYDALLLVAPQRMFTAAERSLLIEFITNGGLVVAMDHPSAAATPGALQQLLRDTVLASGMDLSVTAAADSFNNHNGDPFAPMITRFADAKHPYLNGVDSIVSFYGSYVLTDSTAIPFASLTAPSNVPAAEGKIASAAGLKRIGKGTLLVLGSAAMWMNAMQEGFHGTIGIAAKDNFTFGLNLFSIDEDYVIAMPAKTPNEIYQLISIPVEAKDVDLIAALKANLGEIDPLKWRLFGRYDAATGRYREFPSAGFTSLARGEAYWLITRGEFSLNFGSVTVLPAQDYFSITIPPGYSMIGNPFPYPVSWKDSRIGDSVQTVLWGYDPSANAFAAESLVLAPFQGYFVKNLSKDSVTIRINPVRVPLAKRGTAPLLADGEWKVTIDAASGKAADAGNTAGVTAGAEAEYDRFDIAEPPTTPTDYLQLRFTNDRWTRQRGSYAVDMRPASPEGHVWEFDVKSAAASAAVTLTLGQSGTLPPDFGLYLVDLGTERVHRFDRSLEYRFTMAKNKTQRRFRLVAGKQTFAEQNTGGIPLTAASFALGQNHPNPFNPSTYIQYTLGHSGMVQLEIYNVLGQRVRQLRNEQQAIGTHRVEWDGKDDAGETVSSGVYFYKVTVTSNNEKLFSETKKMVLMK
ncbi:MAG: T9SS type A sorting domain-containing protein [Bacteroidetes bacterium]|nr:T9SS type A sorting domain-containing protein [Bacteroidota bacterium]